MSATSVNTTARAARGGKRSGGWLAPTPPSVAIEIAQRRVTVVEITPNGDGAVVSAYASEPLPADAVTPSLVGVNVPDTRVVADAMKRAFERAELGLPRRAALVVPDGIARVSLLHFDQTPARAVDLDQLIRWQLRKSTPFPLEEAQVDHVTANTEGVGVTLAAVVTRRDVLTQYESPAQALGIQAGIVDLAGFNVMNAVMAAGSAPEGDWLLVCLAHDGTTIAILRDSQLMFYRHRATLDEEPLSALVHQTAMYHEDRLGGSTFQRVWLCGAALTEQGADKARRELGDRLKVEAETVDIRPVAPLRDRITSSPGALDSLAAPVGVLLRERVA
jgi:hypothetical protein